MVFLKIGNWVDWLRFNEGTEFLLGYLLLATQVIEGAMLGLRTTNLDGAL